MGKVFGIVKKSVVALVAVLLIGFVIAFCIGIFTAADGFGREGSTVVAGQAGAPEQSGVASNLTNLKKPSAETVTETVEVEAAQGVSDSGARESIAPSISAQGGSASAQPSLPAPSDSARTGASPATPSAPPAPPGPNTQRTWHEPVYTTIHHDAVYENIHHSDEYLTVTEYYSVCSQCKYKVQASIYPHQNETGHTGFASDVPFYEQVLVRGAYDEQKLVQAAWDEQVLVTPGYWS